MVTWPSNSRHSSQDKKAYDIQATLLAQKFKANFADFDVPAEVRTAGPQAVKTEAGGN